MIKDYHMHPRIVTSPERFELFAKKAMEEGIEEICITDHMPLSVSDSADRIPQGCAPEYCRAVRKLAEQYAGRLSVRLGLEVDYYPGFEDEIDSALKAGEYDFLIGSSHLQIVDPGAFERYPYRNEYAQAMIKNSILAAKSGLFDAIAHLDFYRWMFTKPERFPLTDDGYDVRRHLPLIEELLDVLADSGVRLEINTHLAAQKENLDLVYPELPIVEMALSKGVRFCFGSDAHVPEHVGAYLKELRAHPVYGPAVRAWEAEK